MHKAERDKKIMELESRILMEKEGYKKKLVELERRTKEAEEVKARLWFEMEKEKALH
jgi:hypothetical protein